MLLVSDGSNKFWCVLRTIVRVSLLVLSIITIVYSIFFPKIELKKGETIVLNYKQKFNEPGYTAKIIGKDLTDKVSVVGKVNSKKIGIYKIKYSVSFGGFKSSVIRKVKVVDNSSPKITLVGDVNTYVCPNSVYKDDGARAFDNYDGDITNKIEVRKDEDAIVYSVSDSSGNSSVVTRKLIYKDKEKPVINLSSVVYVVVGQSFSKNYSVVDNCDSDLDSSVKISGEVNTNVIGKYTLKYEVSDKAGNTATAEQTVYVKEADGKGTIYLTFDDGPQTGTTDVILDILKEEGVKATFFITNKGDDSLVKREYDEGHTVAIHTASHDYAVVYRSVDAYWSDLKLVQDRIKRITGETSMLVRFPGGSSNTVSRRYSVGIMSTLTQSLLSSGYKYYDWNVDSDDAGRARSADTVYNNVVGQLSHDKVNMVLMHDIKWYTRDALRRIIQYGKENGYTFSRITESTEMIRQRVNN
ncbi:MAG: polysaccharide deacetylase family protein [Bacilli bacterium]|nr:polysaccharide deacetylase family protein [Bacilli bacterium]